VDGFGCVTLRMFLLKYRISDYGHLSKLHSFVNSVLSTYKYESPRVHLAFFLSSLCVALP
jgi:hypothetical protein